MQNILCLNPGLSVQTKRYVILIYLCLDFALPLTYVQREAYSDNELLGHPSYPAQKRN